MKYLLKFNIQTWGGEPWCANTEQLVLKVEFINESVKQSGFCELGLDTTLFSKSYARWIIHLKSCEVIEGPEEIYDPNGNKRFLLCMTDFIKGDILISLEIYDTCTGVKFMGFEPISEEESEQK